MPSSYKIIILQVLIIILFIITPIFSSPDFQYSWNIFIIPPFQREFLQYILLGLFFYFNLYYLMPRYYILKKYFIYSLFIGSCYFLICNIPTWIVPSNPHPFPAFPVPNKILPPPEPTSSSFKTYFSSALFPFLFVTLVSFYLYILRKNREIENAKNIAIISNIKQQLQPHFLFNTLNSIYSLALDQSNQTANGILQLSNLMRYMTNEVPEDKISLDEEISYLKDYIALQLLRTGDHLTFQFETQGEIDKIKITPMILINFVENAFKYGYNPEEKSKINIRLEVLNNHILQFSCYNTVFNKDLSGTNIGLKNSIALLEYHYKEKYKLEISENKSEYTVFLKINLI